LDLTIPSYGKEESSMIQLATDPNASRMSYRPVRGEGDAKESTFDSKRGRTGHAWPFLSRYEPRSGRDESQKAKASDTDGGS
jgi:hypothetical protein